MRPGCGLGSRAVASTRTSTTPGKRQTIADNTGRSIGKRTEPRTVTTPSATLTSTVVVSGTRAGSARTAAISACRCLVGAVHPAQYVGAGNDPHETIVVDDGKPLDSAPDHSPGGRLHGFVRPSGLDVGGHDLTGGQARGFRLPTPFVAPQQIAEDRERSAMRPAKRRLGHQVGLGDDADESGARVDDRDTADAVANHLIDELGQRRVLSSP